jgi:Tat protein secretion system quality control protein TatD with DNase activity
MRERMAEVEIDLEKELFPWHLGVFDAHCHPTDTVASLDSIASMKTRALTIMATREQDQSIVANFANRLGVSKETMPILMAAEKSQGHVVPSFGWHPWFSHHIYDDRANSSVQDRQVSSKGDHYGRVICPSPRDDQDFIRSLPDPRPLSGLLYETRSHLERYPFALVGEIGLDRSFRIPGTVLIDNGYEKDPALTPGGRDGRRLSPYRVDLDHQRMLLTAQLNLAGEMQRAVSVHGVASHGIVFETLKATWQGYENPVLSKRQRKRRASDGTAYENEDKPEGEQRKPELASPKPFPPRICLHSYSGPSDTLKQYLHPSIPVDIFFSFSALVNFSSQSKKAVAVIKAVPDNRILGESDLHAAGDRMDDLMEDIIRTICQIKGWSLEAGVKQLASNWTHFVFGQRR